MSIFLSYLRTLLAVIITRGQRHLAKAALNDPMHTAYIDMLIYMPVS